MKKSILLILLFFIYCNELPIGEDEIGLRGDFDAYDIELPVFNTFTEYNKYACLGGSRNLIVGKNQEYESRILLKFDFPDSTYQGLDEIKLILKRNDNFHRDTINFSIHLVNVDFEENGANWYQRTNSEWWENEGGDFQEDSIRAGEIAGDSLIIEFNYIELEEIMAADGMIMIPEDTGFVYFYSDEGGNAPQFIIEKNEVVSPIPLDVDCHIVTGTEPFFTDDWIGSGMPYRNYAKFVLDSVLIDKKAVYADLTFEREDYFVMRDSIEIVIRELLEPIDDFNTTTGPLIALEKFAAGDTLFSIDIAKHIQRIIEYPDSNFGIFIIFSPENYDIANLKIISGSHNLRVGYIAPPEER
ncbi:hypothetical protein ES705_41834 [subsurface metagenome]